MIENSGASVLPHHHRHHVRPHREHRPPRVPDHAGQHRHQDAQREHQREHDRARRACPQRRRAVKARARSAGARATGRGHERRGAGARGRGAAARRGGRRGQPPLPRRDTRSQSRSHRLSPEWLREAHPVRGRSRGWPSELPVPHKKRGSRLAEAASNAAFYGRAIVVASAAK